MRQHGTARAQLLVLAVAAALFVFVVVQVALAGTSDSGPKATASASLNKQIKKLKQRVAVLEAKPDQVGQVPATLPPSGPAGGDLAGTYPNPLIAAGTVGSGEVLDESLTSSDLGPNSAGSSEVVDESLTSSDLGPNSAGSSEVVNDSLTSSDLGPNSVGSSEVVDDSLTSADIGNAAVGKVEIASGAVEPQHIAAIPTARVRRTANQTITAGVFTPIQFTSETWDPFNMHTSVGATFLNAPIDGVYLITASVTWSGTLAAPSGPRVLALQVNNTTLIAKVSDDARQSSADDQSVATAYKLAAGDDVRATVQQANSGGDDLSIIASAETSPEFSMTWLGPDS